MVVVEFLFGTVWRNRIPRGEAHVSTRGVRPSPRAKDSGGMVCCCLLPSCRFCGGPLSRYRAIGSREPWSCRGWAKLQRWLSYVCVACQVVTIAPPWPRRLRGLSRHMANGQQQQQAQLRRSYPDVRVACQVVDFVPPWPCRQSGRRIFSHGSGPGRRQNRVTSARSRWSWPRTAGRILVRTAGCGSSICQPAEGSTERGGER